MKNVLVIIFFVLASILLLGVYAAMLYWAVTCCDVIERIGAVFGSNILIALGVLFICIVCMSRDRYD